MGYELSLPRVITCPNHEIYLFRPFLLDPVERHVDKRHWRVAIPTRQSGLMRYLCYPYPATDLRDRTTPFTRQVFLLLSLPLSFQPIILIPILIVVPLSQIFPLSFLAWLSMTSSFKRSSSYIMGIRVEIRYVQEPSFQLWMLAQLASPGECSAYPSS